MTDGTANYAEKVGDTQQYIYKIFDLQMNSFLETIFKRARDHSFSNS